MGYGAMSILLRQRSWSEVLQRPKVCGISTTITQFFVWSDGSKQGVGGYLFQTIGGEERIIAYFSRATRPDEKKWDTRELEILAMITKLEAFHGTHTPVAKTQF